MIVKKLIIVFYSDRLGFIMKNKLDYFLEKLIKWRYKLFLIILLIALSDFLVYLSGGTEFTLTYFMYIPIIFASFVLDMRGALGIAFLGGLSLGPLMPLNVYSGIKQNPGSWAIRMLFFIIVAFIINGLNQCIRFEMKIKLKKSYEHFITGYPNVNKLKLDISNLINNNIPFSVIAFKITNIDEVSCYTDHTISENAVQELLESMCNVWKTENIYSIYTNLMVAVSKDCSIKEAVSSARKFLDRFQEPITISRLPVQLMIKGGLISYPVHGTNVDELLKKIGMTLDQIKENSGFAIYSHTTAQKNEENYETAVSLYEALYHNEFRIVYQPKIDLSSNKFFGYEALIRWYDGSKEKMKPEAFIKIAEDTGFIRELTKWLVKNATEQIAIWQAQGLQTVVSVNISSKDLSDRAIIGYTMDCIKASGINPNSLEFELTERTCAENEIREERILNEIKNNGLKISLDDFGTGYNSLINLVQLPIDTIKIDKSFVDNIQDKKYAPLIQSIIKSAHYMGVSVIAEGVESEEQVHLLKEMGCDAIQGYYYSKPLLPDKIEPFIKDYYQAAC